MQAFLQSMSFLRIGKGKKKVKLFAGRELLLRIYLNYVNCLDNFKVQLHEYLPTGKFI